MNIDKLVGELEELVRARSQTRLENLRFEIEHEIAALAETPFGRVFRDSTQPVKAGGQVHDQPEVVVDARWLTAWPVRTHGGKIGP